jgi:hypothetical protein
MKTFSLSVLLSLGLVAAAVAQTPPASGEMLVLADVDAGALKTENEASVSAVEEAGAKALKMTFPESKAYPGVDIPAPEGTWDLSAFKGVAADVTNSGPGKIGVSLRVENPGDWRQSPWNSNVLWLSPGASGTITVNFGESFGKPGFALDPARVIKVKLFVNSPKEAGEVLLQGLRGIEK